MLVMIVKPNMERPMSDANLSTHHHPRDLEARRRDADAASLFADQWLEDQKALVAQLPARTAIVICVPTGDYVTAPTPVEAMIAFEKRFGKDARGFLHEVGHTTFVGGGIA
jgi:hypothetical protein